MDTPIDHQPYPPDHAAAVSTAIWTALRRREIPHSWATVLECLLWRCRIPNRDRCSISITELRARTGVQRQDIIDATRYAHDRGWLAKVNRRVKAWCEALRRYVGRQAVTLYVWQAPSEYVRPTVLSMYMEKERTRLRKEARKGRGRGVMAMAVRLARWERDNPALLVVIGDAIRTVLDGPRLGLALPGLPTAAILPSIKTITGGNLVGLRGRL